MGTPKRPPAARKVIKGIGNLTRSKQLTPKGQKEIFKRTTRKLR